MAELATTSANGLDVRHERIADILQHALADLTALALNGKQAHWHVRGSLFVPVHGQLDDIVDDARAWADQIAERAVTLGYPVDGRPAAVASGSSIGVFPPGFIPAGDAVAVVAEMVERVVDHLRVRLDELGELDPVTQDLVIELLHGLEKHLWMLRAQNG